jgi:hypothetical protein
MSKGWTGLLGVMGGGAAIAELMHNIAETTMEVGKSTATTGAMLGVTATQERCSIRP